MKEADFYGDLPKIETERLTMRKYKIGDVNDYYNFASDSEVTKYLRWAPHPNKEYTLAYIKGVLTEYNNGKDSPWGIEHRLEKKLIGSIHLMQLDLFHKKAQVGYVLNKSYWNQGYITEALKAVLKFCFSELGLNRIEAMIISDNYAAEQAARKVGMEYEGLMRKYLYQKEKFRNFKLFSLIKED